MNKKSRLIIGIVVTLLVVAGSIFFLNRYVKNEIETSLKDQFPASLNYEEITINIFRGNAALKRTSFEAGIHIIEVDDIQLRSLSYSNFFFSDKVVIDEIRIINPNVTLQLDKEQEKDTGQPDTGDDKNIEIKRIAVEGGKVRVVENDSVDNSLFLSIVNLQLNEVVINAASREQAIPIEYKSAEMESDSLFYNLNEEHTLSIGHLHWKENGIALQELRISPKYNKPEFDRKIPFEKDRVDLVMERVEVNDFEWEILQDSVRLRSSHVELLEANVEIYRNKLLPDDNRIKPMYSEMLRELDFKLQLDSVSLKNSTVVYEEKVHEQREPGRISFHNVEAGMRNISNVGLGSGDFPITQIEAEARFMNESTLTLNWEFDISNEQDEFQVTGYMGGLKASGMNAFLRSAMNVEVEGSIESLYYNFHGNKHTATGDMQLEYSDFKVSILKDNGEGEEKWLLSRLANLILRNDVVDDNIEQKEIQVERDKTKSVWNFLWLCIRDGALKTFL